MRDEAHAARRETTAARRLTLWVGIGAAILGAVLGGIASAFAARLSPDAARRLARVYISNMARPEEPPRLLAV